VTALLASIPSPSSGAIHIGPLQLRAYGLMIALGVIAAVWLTGKRFVQKGIGSTDDVSYIALWAVPAGIIGARLYHVITDWELFRDDPARAIRIWEGGLGIWGGIALGTAVGVWAAKRRGIPVLIAMDCAAPALALAQAIGRWGNWWNRELFGRPTDRPWGLEIPLANRPAGFEQYQTFHPTFLYESLWNLFLCGALLWIDKRFKVRPGRLFVMYVAGYTAMRFWIERLRIDPANKILGLRVNEWTSLVLFTASVVFLIVDHVRHRNDEPELEPEVVEPSETAEVEELAHGTGDDALDIPDDHEVGLSNDAPALDDSHALDDADALDIPDVESDPAEAE
jgi:prolipoprotein diacylglyceryl transferase